MARGGGSYNRRMAQTLVNWREWGEAAFADAEAQNKPILLGISAVWCHWCHVMDRGVPGDAVHTGVYSDAQIAEFINANFVPVRVDNDQRPDINARYNMGGWPTTSFLTPGGDVIYGGTYFSPRQMRNLLPQIADYWRKNKDELLQRAGEGKPAVAADEPLAAAAALPDDVLPNVVGAIARGYDARHGGLGDGTKFPMSDAWALLLNISDEAELPVPGGQRMRAVDMARQTLIAMGTRGMYDMVDGGWFRYSTTPDWTVPHFEKMLEDHARLLPVYLNAFRRTGDAALKQIAQASLDYLTSTLLRDAGGVTYFAGSQDADEEYYALARSERAGKSAPFIDWRLYADWNALMVPALLDAAVVLGRPTYADLARKVLATIDALCVGADGGVTHSITFGPGEPSASALRGALGDQAAVAAAHLALAQHSVSPDERGAVIAQARHVLDFARRALAAPGGGFYDRPDDPSALGMLKVRIKTMADNAAMADALLALSALDDDGPARAEAVAALGAFAGEYARFREHGAPYGLAVMRATMGEPTEIVIVGEGAQAAEFLAAAHTPYAPWRVVRVLHPIHDADYIAGRGYPLSRTPAAFVCRGMTCSAPIYDAGQLAR